MYPHKRKLFADQGLYSPEFEHDACGVGLICNLKGQKSHGLIHKALEILVNLTHRGATGCDPLTGDGAGILFQIPHKFFKSTCANEGINIPEQGNYGAGLVFLPENEKERTWCMAKLEDIVKAQGQEFLGWRKVPVNNAVIGQTARDVEPEIMQVFIGRESGIVDETAFERKLYVIRKLIENAVRNSDMEQKSYFHIPSLSCRTMVYKGLLLADQMEPFYADLANPDMESALALVHQRYSTNTFPTWDLAQPFRFLCHNGEINTVRGNFNWMNARQYLFESELFGDVMKDLYPVLTPGSSDSATLDNALELLYHTGRPLPHAMMMLIPEAWQNNQTISEEKKAFYEYHSCLMEPWDGPASIPFTDGKCIGAVLDRNGLRPSRYTVTKDGFVVMGSESGVLPIEPENVLYKGRLQPGRMFLVDTDKGRIVDDDEIKHEIAASKPYKEWLARNLKDIPEVSAQKTEFANDLKTRQLIFGYTLEDFKHIIGPTIRDGKEPTGSMGDDAPIAVLSNKPQLLYNYFRHLFAQVTNPPLDAIREECVTSLRTNIGAEQDLFGETEKHCHQIRLMSPILTDEQFAGLYHVDGIKVATLDILFDATAGADSLEKAMDKLCKDATTAVDNGAEILVLTDIKADHNNAPIPALLATAGVHHFLIKNGKRTRCGIVVQTGEARETHHYAVLHAYGAGAVHPYLTIESIAQMSANSDLGFDKALKNYIKATEKGILKIMSKMGISTLHSYRGAQILEAVGLGQEFIDKYFTLTPTKIGGIGIDTVQEETLMRHKRAFPDINIPGTHAYDVGGVYQWRRTGEAHLFNPFTISTLQRATRENDEKLYKQYAAQVDENSKDLCTLRSLLDFNSKGAISIDEVESVESIMKRFKTGAMSYGSISQEAHESLAIAMNRIEGKSNTGEGGEDPARFVVDKSGDSRRSAIKQVASGRFGVTNEYLINSDEIQIKMAQGAKPGEGGQLPGKKVYPWIAKTRHSTPFVQLISPPPHHDIYSIEDLAQLIFDLKNANRNARISVKLVSEVGVGTVAAGVSKGKADVVLISGHDGGTGASPRSSIMHAGMPWELGLAETHQTLVLNDLRDRITVEADGKLMTGRDAAVACLLGAEEFGFSTAPLVVLGCVMMRVCHQNTCPAGIATQDPELRKKFAGDPAHVVNYFRFVAQQLREIMAELGFRSISEMVGRTDCLKVKDNIGHWKASKLDFSRILFKPEVKFGTYCCKKQDHPITDVVDLKLLDLAKPALDNQEKVSIDLNIKNVERTIGTILSSEVAKRYGYKGLADDTITINCAGSAGQSFAAFGAHGITFKIDGDANDYVGKGLSGAKIIIKPPVQADIVPEENILIGNVALYGATSGELYVRGLAGERFCVRNSGATAVVEGIGDHGCEYMTGGRVIVLGQTGINFAAGMSGGIAYIFDKDGDFASKHCNKELVDLEKIEDPKDEEELKTWITNHYNYTGSTRAKEILDNWDKNLATIVKVFPVDYKRALADMAKLDAQLKENSSN